MSSYKYKRRKVRHPVTGEYRDVYGKTWAEVREKCDALENAWAREAELAESAFFWQYAAAWYARVSPDMSAARRRDVAREINNNLCPVIGEKKLAELTSDDVLDVLAARTARSSSARKSTLQILNRILDAAEDAGKIPRNPARKISAGGERTKKKKALTAAQQQTLLEAVGGHRIRLFVLTCLYTGTAVRKRKDPATGQMVKVEVEKRLGDTVPRHPGVRITIDFDVTPHTLRRTYVTRLILGGMDLRRVQYLAGHADPDVTLAIYTDLQDHRPEDLIGDVREIFDATGVRGK